jgi:menaquinone-specific isochorismate synthase
VKVHTRRFDGELDLVGIAGADGYLFEQGGLGLAGQGVAARVPARDALDLLASLEVVDEVGVPGSGPIAFGALPFARTLDGAMVLPSVVAGRADDGTRWVTTVDGAELRSPVAEPSVGAGSFVLQAVPSPDRWCEAVAAAVGAIVAGELEKVVLSRQVLVASDEPIPVTAVLRRLRAAYPASMVFLVEGFLGATPELLVSRTGDVVRSHPHAGTIPRTGDATADARAAAALLASAKDRVEHQISIDMMLDALLPFCSYVDSEPEPSVITLANVQHLATLVEGRLSSPPASVIELVDALHPNPMICGWPTAPAIELLTRLEGYDRGRYTGAVGWMDAKGNGRFGVSIRCAEIEGTTARVFAGNGIVADSDPFTELTETRAKLQAILGALVRP